MPNCTPSLIASQSRNPRRRTATPVVSVNRARPNMGHTWIPNCPSYLLPIPNHLDSQHLSVAEKRVLNLRLGRRLAGEPLMPLDKHEAAVFRLVTRIEDQYPRSPFATVYRSLLTINRAQGKSLMQQGRSHSPCELDILGISIEKGGASVLTDGFLVCGN